MKKTNKADLRAVVKAAPKSTQSSLKKPVLPEQSVSRVFVKMGAMYLNTWTSNFPDSQSLKAGMAIWAKALGDLHINQIALGLEVCESRPGFPPSVGEFKRIAVSLPTKAVAIERVIGSNGVDPLTVAIQRKIGSTDSDSLTREQLNRRISSVYEQLYPVILENHSGDSTVWEPAVEIDDQTPWPPTTPTPPTSEELRAAAEAEAEAHAAREALSRRGSRYRGMA